MFICFLLCIFSSCPLSTLSINQSSHTHEPGGIPYSVRVVVDSKLHAHADLAQPYTRFTKYIQTPTPPFPSLNFFLLSTLTVSVEITEPSHPTPPKRNPIHSAHPDYVHSQQSAQEDSRTDPSPHSRSRLQIQIQTVQHLTTRGRIRATRLSDPALTRMGTSRIGFQFVGAACCLYSRLWSRCWLC
jgi:hypothetical protein